MYGKDEVDVNRSSGFGIADVVECSFGGASSGAALSAEGTGSVFSIACLPFLECRGQIVRGVDSYAGIGMIFTGTGHKESILARLKNKV